MADAKPASSDKPASAPVTGPALSATSDTPVARAEPPISEQRIPGQKEAGDSTKTDAPTEPEVTADPAPETPEGEKKTAAESFDDLPAWAKREITRARNKAKAADASAKESAANLSRALAALEEANNKSAADTIRAADAADPKPDRAKFDDPAKYDDALADWAARRATREATAKIETDRAKEKTAAEKAKADAERGKIMGEFTARRDDFIKTHPDYEEVVERDDLAITPTMAQAIMNGDSGPAVAYYLGQNPDEADRISKCGPINQVYEMGRIAARLEQKPNASPKPAPINPLKSGAAAATRKTANEESMAEYGARRSAEVAAERMKRPGMGAARPAVTH